MLSIAASSGSLPSAESTRILASTGRVTSPAAIAEVGRSRSATDRSATGPASGTTISTGPSPSSPGAGGEAGGARAGGGGGGGSGQASRTPGSEASRTQRVVGTSRRNATGPPPADARATPAIVLAFTHPSRGEPTGSPERGDHERASTREGVMAITD